jgi:hypothetical protein
MNTAEHLDQLRREAADLAWLVRMASDLASKADREGEWGDVTRVAVLLRAIVRGSDALANAVSAAAKQGGAA